MTRGEVEGVKKYGNFAEVIEVRSHTNPLLPDNKYAYNRTRNNFILQDCITLLPGSKACTEERTLFEKPEKGDDTDDTDIKMPLKYLVMRRWSQLQTVWCKPWAIYSTDQQCNNIAFSFIFKGDKIVKKGVK